MTNRTNPAYGCWREMRRRCCNPGRKDFKYYGARGIAICERWDSFDIFLADMGPRPSAQHSIDRIDVNGNYAPDNCRWATATEQAANKRPMELSALGKSVVIDGQSYSTILAACAATGMSRFTISARLRRGFSIEDAFTVPLHRRTTAQPVEIGGVRYDSILTAAKAMGVNYRTTCYRLKAGEAPESALTRPPDQGGRWRHRD